MCKRQAPVHACAACAATPSKHGGTLQSVPSALADHLHPMPSAQVLELPPGLLPLQAASFTALETLVASPPAEGSEAAWDAILFGLR